MTPNPNNIGNNEVTDQNNEFKMPLLSVIKGIVIDILSLNDKNNNSEINSTSEKFSIEVDKIMSSNNIYDIISSLKTNKQKKYFFDKINSDEKLKEEFLKLCREQKDLGKVNFTLGAYFYGLGYFEESIIQFEKALENKHNSNDIGGIYYNIGGCYFELGEYEESIKFFKKALKNNINKNLIIYINNSMGCSYLELGEYNQAIINFKKALNNNDYNENLSIFGEIYYNIGDTYNELGNFQEAIFYLTEALKYKGEHIFSGYYDIGTCYMELGEYEKAISSFNETLKDKKIHEEKDILAGIFINIGTCYMELGNYKEAIFYLKQALKYENITDDIITSYIHQKLSDCYRLKSNS